MITKLKLFESISKQFDFLTLTKISKIVFEILNSRKYLKYCKNNAKISFSRGGCLMTYTVLYKLFKNYGAKKYVVVEYCETENDYPVDHITVGFDINGQIYYMDSDGLFTKNEMIEKVSKNTDNDQLFLVPFPNKNKKMKIWDGELEMWWDENIMNEMEKDISKKIEKYVN